LIFSLLGPLVKSRSWSQNRSRIILVRVHYAAPLLAWTHILGLYCIVKNQKFLHIFLCFSLYCTV
jgi:hypothetical protein